MKNVVLLFGVLVMMSCGTSSVENSNDNVIIIRDTTKINTPSLDVSGIETVGELLDVLESIPSDSTVVE